MKKLTLLLIVLLCSCTKNTNTVKSITVTYNLYAKIQPHRKLFIQYVTSYGTGQYQYGKLVTDTLNTDSFSVTVTYNVNNIHMQGQAGYFAAAIVVYPDSGKPYLEPPGQYYNYGYNGFYSESVVVNAVYLHNYPTPDGVYIFKDTYCSNFKNYFTTQYAYW